MVRTFLKGSKGIERFKHGHYDIIKKWYKARKQTVPARACLSDVGFIADGRAAGWLYLTNSNIAMIEGIVSDPNTVPSLRRASLNKLIGILVDTAVSLGYTNIIGLSNHPGISRVGARYGFKETKMTLLSLNTEDHELKAKIESPVVYEERDYVEQD